MREAAKIFYQRLYTEEFSLPPKLDNLHFDTLDTPSRESLEVEFTEDEIFTALKSCNGDKAPGPDGFNFKFLLSFWTLIKDDVVNLFMEFHRDGLFIKSLNSTFVVLIPKKEGPQDFKDFCPINLVSSMYKLISKVLSRRLANVLHLIIGENQHAFVEGKQIFDVFMIANELVDDLITQKKKGIMCKLDMEKAFDHVSWSFIDYMLLRFGFGCKWRKWISICISTISYAVLVNGGPFFSMLLGVLDKGTPYPLFFLLL